MRALFNPLLPSAAYICVTVPKFGFNLRKEAYLKLCPEILLKNSGSNGLNKFIESHIT